MARILFTVPPLTGHLNPALAVADILASQGHIIAWAVHARQIGGRLPVQAELYPLDPSEADVTCVSLPTVRGLESVRLFFEDYMMPMARQVLGSLEEAVRDFRPDVLVVDHQMPAGALVARKLDVPWVTLVTTTASIQKMSPSLDAWVEEQFLELQTGYLPPERIVARPDFSPYNVVVFSMESLMGTTHTRVDAPYSFVGPAHGLGRRFIEFPWQWLRPDSRKLLISVGTVSRDGSPRFFEVMLEAMRHLPEIQAVMVAPPELASRAPDNVLVCNYVPQLELLDRVDGVVCHAGHNTVCEALTRGLPLIVAPIRDDQPVIARQVIDAGAALFMRYGKVTPATAIKLIEELFATPSLALNAQKLGRALSAAPGALQAAEDILALADDIADALQRVA